MIPPEDLNALLDSSTGRGFNLFPQTYPNTSYVGAWFPLLMQDIQALNPHAQGVIIAENGNTTDEAKPGGTGPNVNDAEAYFGTPLTRLFVQFQTNGIAPATNVANLVLIRDFAEAMGTDVWICTPHPILNGTTQENDDLIEQKNLVIATFPLRYIDMWTDFVAVNGRDAKPEYMLDDDHWNDAGMALAKTIAQTATGLGL